jgi:hypothetical protein
MLASGMICYHLERMVSSGTKCYHLGLHVIIWDKMLSSGAIVIMVSSGANVIIWCYHVMLSSGMIKHPFFIFPENFTHSYSTNFHIVLSSSVFYIYFISVYCILFSLYIMICDFSQEFVACQDDRDPGVLILSPFAGAGGLMQEALQVSHPSQLVSMYCRSHYHA